MYQKSALSYHVFTRVKRERFAGQGEPFLLLLLLRVSFRLWRLRGESAVSSENVQYAAGGISEKCALKALSVYLIIVNKKAIKRIKGGSWNIKGR